MLEEMKRRSNGRITYTMYAGANDDRIAGGFVSNQTLDFPMWAKPPIDLTGNYISGDGATFSFIDGHTERHTWKHKETWLLFDERQGQKAPATPPVNSNLDIRWCWEHYPYLSANEKPTSF